MPGDGGSGASAAVGNEKLWNPVLGLFKDVAPGELELVFDLFLSRFRLGQVIARSTMKTALIKDSGWREFMLNWVFKTTE